MAPNRKVYEDNFVCLGKSIFDDVERAKAINDPFVLRFNVGQHTNGFSVRLNFEIGSELISVDVMNWNIENLAQLFAKPCFAAA